MKKYIENLGIVLCGLILTVFIFLTISLFLPTSTQDKISAVAQRVLGKNTVTVTLILPNGTKYVGEVKDGKMNGQGTATFLNGIKYVGEWKDGKRNGKGTAILPDGIKYAGEWKDDKMNGVFTSTFLNGMKESSIYIDNKKVE